MDCRNHASASASAPCHSLATPAYIIHTLAGDIARREAESFVDMSFRLHVSADEVFCQADVSVAESQIWIQCQSALALSDALSNPVRKDLDRTPRFISHGMVRRNGKGFDLISFFCYLSLH